MPAGNRSAASGNATAGNATAAGDAHARHQQLLGGDCHSTNANSNIDSDTEAQLAPPPTWDRDLTADHRRPGGRDTPPLVLASLRAAGTLNGPELNVAGRQLVTAGEFLTVDYGWDGKDGFVCKCGHE
jgi:hypothetical protein